MFKRFTLGVAVGYVLGARAGQKRYEQIADLAERAMQLPWVERLADSGRTIAEDQGQRVLSSLRERAGWFGDSGDEDDEYGDEDDEYYDDDDDQGVQDEADGDYEEDAEEDDASDEGEARYAEEDDKAYDEADEGSYDGDSDEGPDAEEEDETYDEADEDEPDKSDEEEADEERQGNTGRRSSRSRRGVGSVVSAARERGRVA